jgi:hypothetical protein
MLPRDKNCVSVECLTDGDGLLPPDLRVLEGPIQAWLFRVQEQGTPSSSLYVIVNASHPEFSEERCLQFLPAIARCFEPATISFVLKSKEGSASVVTPGVGAEEAPMTFPRVAAAVAIQLCSGAWDESERIEVSVNGRLYSIRPSFTERTWQAQW